MSRKEERDRLEPLGILELQRELKEAREELFQNRLRYATHNLENPEPLRKGKKRIARILTYIRQRELEQQA
jgi:large subunit ribosomal protein L29